MAAYKRETVKDWPVPEGLRDVTGAGGRYAVTADGRVFSYITWRWLKQVTTPNGYRVVAFSENKKPKTYFVHVLVARTWIPSVDGKPRVNHKNGVKADNSVENLEWCTSAENNRHAYRTGLIVQPKGEARTQAKLTDDAVRLIRSGQISKKAAARRFGVNIATIHNAAKGKTWSHVA